MEAKLTLKLDKDAIDLAKQYAKKHKSSLSRMVENYFRNISSEHNYRMKHSSVVESLTGILSEDDLEKFAGEDERVKYILTKDIVIQTTEEYIDTTNCLPQARAKISTKSGAFSVTKVPNAAFPSANIRLSLLCTIFSSCLKNINMIIFFLHRGA